MTFPPWLRVLTGGWLRRTRLENLKDAVKAHLPLLPVVNAQLRDANRQMEQAVTQVGANFERMVESAREGVNQASRLVGTDSESAAASAGGVGALLTTSRTTLEDLMVRIVRDSEICRNVVQRIDSFENDMDRIVCTLADVDRISFGNTILALNAKIEAAHIGDRGQGFEVVAQELWTQARKSEEITAGIRANILRMAGEARTAAAEIGQMACADGARIAELQRQVQESLDFLVRAHGDMRQSIAEAGQRSEALSREISGAVQSMQFQDRVSQRIVHIAEALKSMQAALEAPLQSLGERPASEIAQSHGADLLSGSYTMASERSVHAATLGERHSEELPLDDVEIF